MFKKRVFRMMITALFCAMLALMLAGCEETTEDPTIPSEIRGTWIRQNQLTYTNTISFTADTYKLSQQSYSWRLKSVSGEVYSFSPGTGSGTREKRLVLINDTLEISLCSGTGIDNCNGIWLRQ